MVVGDAKDRDSAAASANTVVTGALPPAAVNARYGPKVRDMLKTGLSDAGFATRTDAFGVEIPRKLVRMLLSC